MSTYSDASLILPVAPEYKAGKIYSLKPTNGSGDFTVARASKKHRINSDLKLAIIDNDIPAFNFDTIGGCPFLNTEPQATNLITYPISFGNSYWTKSGATIDGDPSTAGSELVTNGDFSVGTGWTVGANWAIGSGVATITTGNSGDDLVQSIGLVDGTFYKIEVTVSGYSAGSVRMNFLGTGGFYGDFSANGTYVGYAYGGSDPRLQIVATTTTTTLSIDNVSVKEVQGYSAPSVNFPTSAFKLVEDTSTGGHRLYTIGTTSAISNFSVFAKAGERTQLLIEEFDDNAYFDLSNGTILSQTGDADAKIEAFADGWYRCSIKTNILAGNSLNFYTSVGGSSSYAGDGTSGLYLFMAQLEESSVATSPTFTDTTLASEGSTTTRLADVVGGAGDTTLYSGLNASGVLFIHSRALSNVGTDRGFTLSDGTTNNRVKIYYDIGGGDINAFVYNEADLQCLFTFSATITDWHKIAIRWAVNDFSLWVDGVEVGTDTSGTIFGANILSDLSFNDNGSDNFFADINSVKTLPYQTDTEMATLTTL